eukprot:Skav221530  [mRNA]  locus=scaffold1248:339768:341246:- [translate_table: standard]
MIAPSELAADWITALTSLAPDELGLYVIGHPPQNHRLTMLSVNAPATNIETGQDVLLNGVLIQFGSKHLTTPIDMVAGITTKAIQVASITVWKSDFEEPMWSRIMQAPVKTILQLLALEGYQAILTKPWGRVWQDQGITVAPALASSFQFHGEFEKTDRFGALLKRSGFNKIYVNPKGADGRADPAWKVIWLPGTPLELETKSSAIQASAGLVKSKKGYGIRVETNAFQNVWKALKPDQEAPDVEMPALIYKLFPLPHGVDHQILKDWAMTNFKWRIKPIKAIGAKAWVVACDEVPAGFLTFNTQPLLLQQLPQKGVNNVGLIATASRPSASASSSEPKPNPYRLGDPYMDPWASSVKTTDDNAARKIEGPVSTMLQQQGTRIQNLEDALQKIHTEQQANMQTLNEKQDALNQVVTQHVAHTQQGFDHVAQEHRSIHDTIARAMQKQDERLAATFDDLKQLFLTTRGQKRGSEGPHEDATADAAMEAAAVHS